jgi:hypothetical protein
MLEIKDTILKECLHVCNQNFDKRKYYCCVQCSDDDWMVWNFYYDSSKIDDDISGMAPKFLNVFHVRLKRFLSTPFLRCDCLFFERYVIYLVGNSKNNLSLCTHIFVYLLVVDCHVSMFSR